MTRWLSIASATLVALALTTDPATASSATQQEPKPAPKTDVKAKPQDKAVVDKDRVDGTVESLDKAKSMLLVRARPGGTLRQVMLGSQTSYSVLNKAGSLDDLKTGSRVICLGQFNDKRQLVATRCDVRQSK